MSRPLSHAKSIAKRLGNKISKNVKKPLKATRRFIAREKAKRFEGTVVRFEELPESVQKVILTLPEIKTAKVGLLVLGAANVGSGIVDLAKGYAGITNASELYLGLTIMGVGQFFRRLDLLRSRALEKAVRSSDDTKIKSLREKYEFFFVRKVPGRKPELVFTNREGLFNVLGTPVGRRRQLTR
ncbi:MAG: hypothetical protein QXM75_01895 [Candidatus Diapherotrites archaeon]